MRIKQIELNGFKSFMEPTVLELPLGRDGDRRPERLRQVEHRRRHPLGARRAEPEAPPRRRPWRTSSSTATPTPGRSAWPRCRSPRARRGGLRARRRRRGDARTGAARTPCRRSWRSASEIAGHAALLPLGRVGVLHQPRAVSPEGHHRALPRHRRRHKAYAIIEQGRVEQLVNAKPEELRLFIEEAAGTTRFRSRKIAAERKMERTRDNLLRVQDVLRELERQMASLERQAKRAEEYHRIKDELAGSRPAGDGGAAAGVGGRSSSSSATAVAAAGRRRGSTPGRDPIGRAATTARPGNGADRQQRAPARRRGGG